MDDPVRGGKNWSSIFDFLMTNEIQVIFCYMQIFFLLKYSLNHQ